MFTFSGDTAPLASNAIAPPPGACGVIPAVPTAACEMSPAVFGTLAGSTKFPSIVSKTIGSVGSWVPFGFESTQNTVIPGFVLDG